MTIFGNSVRQHQEFASLRSRLSREWVKHLPEIDERICRYCENYEFRRISAVDRNVLRLAIYEMLYRDDIPPVVSINEAIELAKTFGGGESGRFVNGILDRIRKDLDRPAREPVTKRDS